MPEANIHEVSGFEVLIIGILVWFLGNYITDTVTGMTGTSRDCFAIHAMILVIEYPV